MSTAWLQLLSCGSDDDFLISLNVTRSLFLNILLPLFATEKATVNYGSPFRKGPKIFGRRSLFPTVDLLGMALWFMKTKSAMYQLCPVFGMTPTNLSVWLEFSLEVLIKVVTGNGHPAFRMKWPTPPEMRQSAALL